MTTPNFEKVCELNVNLTSPIEVNDALYLVAQNGDIFKLKEGQLKNEFHLGGNPSGITVDGKNLFVAEMANQAILNKSLEEKTSELTEMTKDFESNKFLGPNSITYSAKQRCLYFTDSGPFCDTSIENKKGSVFAIELENQILRPLALNCLAYPCGLALAQDDKILFQTFYKFYKINRYVCETCENRILRFVSTSQGISYFSTFIQFVGRFGPTACEVSASNLLYVARYEFATNSSEGLITIVNSAGQIVGDITIDGYPEITGLTFSKIKQNLLYVTENSTQPCCLRVSVPQEEKEEFDDEKKHKKMLI